MKLPWRFIFWGVPLIPCLVFPRCQINVLVIVLLVALNQYDLFFYSSVCKDLSFQSHRCLCVWAPGCCNFSFFMFQSCHVSCGENSLLYTRQKRGGRLDQEYKKRMQTKLNEESFYFLLAIVRYDTINMIYLKKMSEDSNLSRNILIKKAKFRWAFENFFCFLFEEVAADVSVLTFKIRGRKLSKLWIQTYIKLVTLETSLV